MPTYEFRCPRGHEFEKFYRSIGTSEANPDCPQCGLPAERQMSAAGFAFKGSGFYLTDYGKNAHRKDGAPAREGAAAESGGESAKAEGKTDSAAAPGSSESKAAEPKADAK